MNEHLKTVALWALERLQEKSTWHGIIVVLSAIFVGLKPDQAEAIITAGAAISGHILVGTKGYRQINFRGGIYLEHRIIWIFHNGDIPDGMEIDHEDLNKSNNTLVIFE